MTPRIFSVTSANLFTFLKNGLLFWDLFLINPLKSIDLVGYFGTSRLFSEVALIIVCWLNANVVWPRSRFATKFVKVGENEAFRYIFLQCECVCACVFNFPVGKLITKKRP